MEGSEGGLLVTREEQDTYMLSRDCSQRVYIACVQSRKRKGAGRACTGDGGATAEPVNLLLLLEDQISKSTFLKETNRSNEREPKLRANFLEA